MIGSNHSNHYTHRVASDEATLPAVLASIAVVFFILTFLVSSYILLRPVITAYDLGNEARCHRYLHFRHLTGEFEGRTQQCIAKTKTGSYILDPKYY